MILVTGATGQLGGATIDFLSKKTATEKIAGLARNVSKAKELNEKGVEIRIGDYTDYQSLMNAFSGVDKLLESFELIVIPLFTFFRGFFVKDQ